MSNILLKDRVEFAYGFSVRVNDEQSGEYPVFGSNGITGYIDSYKVEGPGVIIGRKGSVGAIRFSYEHFTPTDTAYCLLIKDKTKDDIKFWYYYLQLLGLEKLNTHSSVPGLSREIAYFVNIKSPDISEQQKIAAVLSALDAKIELNQRINAELESMAKTLYDYWFVQFDFPNEKGKPFKSAGGKMVSNEELKREIPLGWEVGELTDIVNVYDSKRIPLSNVQREKIQGKYRYYGATSVMDYINDFIFDGEYILIAEDGSVMDEKGFPFVQYIWGKTWVNNHAHVLQPKDLSNYDFLFFLLKSISVVQIMTGSVQKKINQENLAGVKFATPDKNTLKLFSEFARPIRKRIINLTEESQTLTELRDWLLPMLMNGQVRA